jgi:hypothetical protein
VLLALLLAVGTVLSFTLTDDVAGAARRRVRRPATITPPVEAPAVAPPSVELPAVDAPADDAPPEQLPTEVSPLPEVSVPAPAPVDAAPVDPAPVDSAPVDPAPVDSAPVDRVPVVPAPAAPAAPVASGRQPILFWVGSNELDQIVSGAGPQNLDSLQAAGIGGYVSMTRLLGAGGVPIPDWMVSEWRHIGDRGQQVYPGVYASTPTSPFADLFDDNQWATVRSGMSHIADRAREAGAAGMALDLENYGVSEALWSVHYPGNTHDAATTRAKMFDRGQELAPIFASVGDLLVYSSSIASTPGSYQDAVQSYVGNHDHYADNMFPDFIRGLLAGGARVTVIDSVFAGGIHLPNRSWDSAISESVGLTHGLFPGAGASIMVWPENGSSPAAAIAIGSRLSTGPVVIYHEHLIDGSYDYGPYLAALRAALG